MAKTKADVKKLVIIIGIMLSTIGGITANPPLIGIGGLTGGIGTLMVSFLK